MPSPQSRPLAWITPERNSPVPLQTQIAFMRRKMVGAGLR